MFFVVGVFADDVIASAEYKGRPPVIPCEDRVRCVAALKCVDAVVVLHDREYVARLRECQADVLAVGESWGSHPKHREAVEYMKSINGRVVRFPYTRGISTTQIKHSIIAGKPARASTSCP